MANKDAVLTQEQIDAVHPPQRNAQAQRPDGSPLQPTDTPAMYPPAGGRMPVLAQRESSHGSFSVRAGVCQGIKAMLTPQSGFAYTAVQQLVLGMIADKLSRIVCGNPNEIDHWRDLAGYAGLAVEDLTPKLKEEVTRCSFTAKVRSLAHEDPDHYTEEQCEWEPMHIGDHKLCHGHLFIPKSQ